MKNKVIRNISIAVFVIVLAGIIIIPKLKSEEAEEAPRPRGRGSAAITVDIKVIEQSAFQSKIQASGTIIPNEEVDLRTESSGKIIAITFKEGQKVKKGEMLVKINDAELQTQLQKAVARKKLAEEKEYRQRVLLSKEGTSQELYDTALNELNSIQSDIENIKALIAKTEIKAPFDGIIGLRYVSEGAYVSPATQIANLLDASSVKIDFSVPQRFAGSISVGSKVTIATSSGKELPVKIYAVEQKIDAATRALKVRGICPNEKGILVPGSYVTVNINLDNITNAITIPTHALSLDIDGEIVYLYKNGKAISKRVESGIRTESEVQIVHGLSVGDSVIVSGIIQLRSGANVKLASIEKTKN